MPSTSPSRPMKRPNSVLFLTSPSTVEPTGCFSAKASHGFCKVCLRPSEMRRLAASTSSTWTSTSGMDVLLGPRHFRDVNKAFDARLELDERAVVGDVGDAALQLLADVVAGLDRRPRIFLQLLHAERDAVRLVVDLDDAHLDLLADRQHFARMVDAPPGDVGHVQKAVDAAEIDERAIVGEVLDRAVDDL